MDLDEYLREWFMSFPSDPASVRTAYEMSNTIEALRGALRSDGYELQLVKMKDV